ncbi:MAG: tetratricopeptide repeat protein [Chitinophagales bacterium]
MKSSVSLFVLFIIVSQCGGLGCTENAGLPSKTEIDKLELKRGQLISCGATEKQFGKADFEISCAPSVKEDFDLALELLHSFEYDESEKMFSRIIDKEPSCSMAFWGIAMCNLHLLWTAPSLAELQKGAKAIQIAKAHANPGSREAGYINALGEYYKDWERTDPNARNEHFEKAMEKLSASYPSDKEAAIFYALALIAAADPADKSYKKQRRAGSILFAIYPSQPDHPGIIHYIIHAYDYPGLAEQALPEARKYASVAPSSAHALHMPSHIFTRLGLWDECIQSNLASLAAAKCYARAAGIRGHWDEELHAMDYLVYAYLQKGNNDMAKTQVDSLLSIYDVYPVNFKVAYAFAAIPSRYMLENRKWHEAASLKIYPADLPWNKFPWQEALIHFTRVLGAAQTRQMDLGNVELDILGKLYDTLESQRDFYKSRQVEIQLKAGQAWLLFKSGKKKEGLQLMTIAADMEDSTEKHPVTPGALIPARELLGDMLMESNQPKQALVAYEADLTNSPYRRNGLIGASMAAKKSGDKNKAKRYLLMLVNIEK